MVRERHPAASAIPGAWSAAGALPFSAFVERDLRALVRQDEALTVGRHQVKVIGGDETARIDGRFITYVGQDLSSAVTGELRQHIGGTHSLLVDSDQHQQIGGAAALEAGGPIHIKAHGSVVIEAPDVGPRLGHARGHERRIAFKSSLFRATWEGPGRERGHAVPRPGFSHRKAGVGGRVRTRWRTGWRAR
jgi:type VI secretion system secreted protein VgrG